MKHDKECHLNNCNNKTRDHGLFCKCSCTPREEKPEPREWEKRWDEAKQKTFVNGGVMAIDDVPPHRWEFDEDAVKKFITKEVAHTRHTTLDEVIALAEGEILPTTKIEDCENCGEQGWGKAWYGHGKETGDNWGDRYYPTGEVVFCEKCKDDFNIGREWDGERIWKVTSDRPENSEVRLRHITKSVNKEYNTALSSLIAKVKEMQAKK